MIWFPALAVLQILWVNEKIAMQNEARNATMIKARQEMNSQCQDVFDTCRRIHQFTVRDDFDTACDEIREHGPICL